MVRGFPWLARVLAGPRIWKALRHFVSFDLIVSSGGTYLVRNYWLIPVVFELRVALLLRKPLILYTQSVDHFDDLLSRLRLRPIFKRARLILLRDEQSHANIKEIVPTLNNVHIVADVAFSLADRNRLVGVREKPPESEARTPRVAVSVRNWPYFKSQSHKSGLERYSKSIARAVTDLVIHHGAEVDFLSTCQGVREYRYDDSKVATQICQLLTPAVRRSVRVDSDFHTPKELRDMLSSYDFVISTRMHFAIQALGAGVPVFPIAYEFKTAALFERLGLSKWVEDIEYLTPERLTRAVDKFMSQLDQLVPQLFERVELLHDEALATQDLLQDMTV
jgi:colanic acid/amylovoran biosynthesis protein